MRSYTLIQDISCTQANNCYGPSSPPRRTSTPSRGHVLRPRRRYFGQARPFLMALRVTCRLHCRVCTTSGSGWCSEASKRYLCSRCGAPCARGRVTLILRSQLCSDQLGLQYIQYCRLGHSIWNLWGHTHNRLVEVHSPTPIGFRGLTAFETSV